MKPKIQLKKNVWMLNHYAQEPGGPGGTRHFSLAYHLQRYGWTASIIAASTELNTNRQRLNTEEESRVDCFDGVPFLWLKTPPYKGNGGGRMVNMLTYTYRAVQEKYLASLPRPDVVIGSSVHPFAAWAGARLAARYRVPFLFEVRDLWPQTLIDLGRITPNGLQARVMRALEKSLYNRAVRTITLLPRAWVYIESLGIPRERVFWLPNGVDLSGFPYAPVSKGKNPFVFMYFGAHGNANGLDNVLRAFALLEADPSAPEARLRLIGDGPMKSALRRLATELGLRGVTFEDPIPKSRIPALAAEADAYVFNLVDAPVFRYGISSNKLFDFLAGGRPVIFSCDAANNPVEEAKAGLTVPPGNPERLAGAMRTLATMPIDRRRQFGENARRYVEQTHDYSKLAGRLAGLLDEVIGR